MPEAGPQAVVDAAAPHWLCAAADLAERGTARVFDLLLWGRPARGFVLRFDGRVVGYVNRCLHVPVEMDWQPGEFLDHDRRWIVCSIHGASYDPTDGGCIGGPCGRGRLLRIELAERDGQVYWYSSRDLRPAPAAAPDAAPDSASESPP